ncbi:MAG: hypothetical protein CL897_05360 [Dehalococcoidia bacterium]|nr:hypothetical protein [Dehalococcoidia bacterium]|tara:strand:+ start:1300 stop:2217 length:918 start_codon:yes stop_codon:yes gene_type:complete
MSTRIGVGAALLPGATPASFFRWIDLCEESDLDSIWLSERLASRQPALEPMAAIAAIAGRTKRIKFGMNVVLLPLRDPLVLATQCATIDFLSEGRLLPAFGVGALNAPEWRATGRKPQGRGAIADEMIDLIVRLWEEEVVTFEGEHFRYESASIAPKPIQQPLPLWIGGSSDAAIKRTAKRGTGWLAGIQTPAQVAPVIKQIKTAAREAGRTIDEDHYGAGFPFRFGTWDDDSIERTAQAYKKFSKNDPVKLFAIGGADEIVARVRDYEEVGISKFVLRPLADSEEDAYYQTQRLIEEVLPTVHT